jgi:hypothetical protein
VQKVPKKPVEIDMPALASTDVHKHQHSDFYKPETKEVVEVKSQSLITQKLEELGANVKQVEK